MLTIYDIAHVCRDRHKHGLLTCVMLLMTSRTYKVHECHRNDKTIKSSFVGRKSKMLAMISPTHYASLAAVQVETHLEHGGE